MLVFVVVIVTMLLVLLRPVVMIVITGLLVVRLRRACGRTAMFNQLVELASV